MKNEEAEALEEFGLLLMQWREYASKNLYAFPITQAVLAKKMNRSRTYISQLESGLRNPSLIMLLEFAKFFDVGLSDFFRGPEKYKKGKKK